MTYKQLESCRELRLWITNVLVPTCVGCYIIGKSDIPKKLKVKFDQLRSKED